MDKESRNQRCASQDAGDPYQHLPDIAGINERPQEDNDQYRQELHHRLDARGTPPPGCGDQIWDQPLQGALRGVGASLPHHNAYEKQGVSGRSPPNWLKQAGEPAGHSTVQERRGPNEY